MTFEFDEVKSQNNKKHGIDFVDAQRLWVDPECVLIRARTEDEARYLLIASYDHKIWSTIFTMSVHYKNLAGGEIKGICGIE